MHAETIAQPAPRQLPTPRRALPLLGHLPWLARDPLSALERFAKEVGDVYRVQMPSHELVVVNRPSEIEKILTASHGFIKDKDLRKGKSLFGEGLLTSEG